MELTQGVSINKTLNFIKENFRQYYEKKGVEAPAEIEKREFGFGNEKKIDYRHQAFRTEDELKQHFVENVPLYGSYSAALYEFPKSRPMEKKNRLGADLIFEFDAECDEKCSLTCLNHLDMAKKNTRELIKEFLVGDFGFDIKDISIVFSGSRGYHIYVSNEKVRKISSNARREIADYIYLSDSDLDKLLDNMNYKDKMKPSDSGWKGRIAKQIYKVVEKSNKKQFKDKPHVLSQINIGNYDVIGNRSFFKNSIKDDMLISGSNIDQGVTLDIHKLIRIPSSIHGGSSLLCMKIANLDELDRFDPFKDPVVFNNPPVKIKFNKNISTFTLKNQNFGPFEINTESELPEYAALFLICKGAAVIA